MSIQRYVYACILQGIAHNEWLMSNVYSHHPEYRAAPLEPEIRQEVYSAFIDIAAIDADCERRPSGMYMAKQARFDRRYFFDEISQRTGLGSFATAQAVRELGILRITGFSDTYKAIVHPQAVLFTDGYQEEHTREAFRFALGGRRQYYWVDSPRS